MSQPAVLAAAAAQPYASPYEHLGDLLRRLDLRVRRELSRHPRERPADFLSFAAITDAEVDALLSGEPGEARAAEGAEGAPLRAPHAQLERAIAERVAATLAAGGRLPLYELARIFALSSLELEVLVACLAPEVDRKYERIFGYLHDDMSRKLPSPGLILALCCGSLAERGAARSAVFGVQAPLVRYRLVQAVEEASASLPHSGKGLQVDERITAFALGERAIDARIVDCVARFTPAQGIAGASASQRAALQTMLAAVGGRAKQAAGLRKPVFYLHGPANAGADLLAQEAARELGLPLLAADAEQLAAARGGFHDALFLLLRESLLAQSAVCLRRVDRVFAQDRSGQQCAELMCRLAEMGGVSFLCGERPWSWPMPTDPLTLLPVELRPAEYGEQLAVWRELARGSAGIDDGALHELVSKHPLAAADIGGVFRMARSYAALREPGARLSADDLGRACRARSSVDFGGAARRIEPRHGWEDLVLPPGQIGELRSVCSQAKRRSKVYGEWGFERKLALGKGLNALFCGPPGTGKTMAAEVIALDLALSLYKIDLSQVVSKYIGETEKNLARVFDLAAAAHAILFFDEADALLGKRSEVRDAHDRYANTEVAYLLQKIEEYEGVAILATNLRQNMDEAFTRRIRFIVEFPFPDETARRGIWERAFPREAPLAADVDPAFLAGRFKLAGGSIRNIALGASFLAAERGQAVDLALIVESGKRELRKMGRLVDDAEYALPGTEAA